MAGQAGSGTMQPETQEIASFRYPESPWAQPPVGESFPVVQPETPGSRSAGPASSRKAERSRTLVMQPFLYGVEPGFVSDEDIDTSADDPRAEKPAPDSEREIANQQLFQQLLASESQKAEERGRGKGVEIGLTLGREEAVRQFQGERERLVTQAATLLESFSASRESWLHQLEREAVELALAIAARILRREAQMDPLLLTGAVRVALGQLAASTAVRLIVPDRDQPMWEEALARMPGLPLRPQVVGDPRMELGECRMETELGSANLGLWPQLKAIERGFFERPGDSSQSYSPGSGQNSSQDSPPASSQDEPEYSRTGEAGADGD